MKRVRPTSDAEEKDDASGAMVELFAATCSGAAGGWSGEAAAENVEDRQPRGPYCVVKRYRGAI